MMLDVDETFTMMIRGQGQGQEMTSVPFRDYFCLSRHITLGQFPDKPRLASFPFNSLPSVVPKQNLGRDGEFLQAQCRSYYQCDAILSQVLAVVMCLSVTCQFISEWMHVLS